VCRLKNVVNTRGDCPGDYHRDSRLVYSLTWIKISSPHFIYLGFNYLLCNL